MQEWNEGNYLAETHTAGEILIQKRNKSFSCFCRKHFSRICCSALREAKMCAEWSQPPLKLTIIEIRPRYDGRNGCSGLTQIMLEIFADS